MTFGYPEMLDFATLIDPTHNQNVVQVAHNSVASLGAYPYPPFLQPGEFNYYAQEPNMVHYDFDFANLQCYPAEDIASLAHHSSPTPPSDVNFLLLSPPTTTPGQSMSPSPPHLPSPDLPLAGSSDVQVQAGVQPTPPSTPPAPAWEPTSQEIERFDFCPYTDQGRICGFVSWTSSGNKAIARHMRRDHFKPGSNATAWKCPNPKCKSKNRSFARKDSLTSHRRKICDPWHLQEDPDYVPLPHIEEGNETEVKRWIAAGHGQRNALKKKLRAGTPWSVDLLRPTHLY